MPPPKTLSIHLFSTGPCFLTQRLMFLIQRDGINKPNEYIKLFLLENRENTQAEFS